MSDLFDGLESERLRRRGMEYAEGNPAKSTLLEFARAVAVYIAKNNNGTATADDVGVMFERYGLDVGEQLGPTAGSIFKGEMWEFTGERVRSTRKKNHARELKVWRLKQEA